MRELDDPSFSIQRANLGDGAAVALPFRDLEVGVRVRCDLGQMGDAQHLVVSREGPQAAPHGIGASAADARVDLVEHQDWCRIGRRQDLLDREGHARQLATRRDLCQRPGRLAGIRCQLERHFVDPGRIEGHRVAVDLDRGFVGQGRPPADRDLEDIGPEAKSFERLTDRGAQSRRGHRAKIGKSPGGPADVREEHRALRDPTLTFVVQAE